MKGFYLFVSNVEYSTKNKSQNFENYDMIQKFEDFFGDIPSLLFKIDIDFAINPMPKVAPISKNPYRMSTLELKELQMKQKSC